jgi:mono/diheme cytochrome c family protein
MGAGPIIVLAVFLAAEGGGRESSGAAQYERLCAACHASDGMGVESEAPPLADSPWISGPEERLIRIVMHGIRGPIQVGGKIHDREMPGFGSKLADRELALLVSFVRNRWGKSNAQTAPETVRRVRAAAGNRNRYWTVEELLNTP